MDFYVVVLRLNEIVSGGVITAYVKNSSFKSFVAPEKAGSDKQPPRVKSLSGNAALWVM